MNLFPFGASPGLQRILRGLSAPIAPGQVRGAVRTGRKPPHSSPAYLARLRAKQRHLSHPPVWPGHQHRPPAIPNLGPYGVGRGTPPPPLVAAVAQAVPAVGTLIQAVN